MYVGRQIGVFACPKTREGGEGEGCLSSLSSADSEGIKKIELGWV